MNVSFEEKSVWIQLVSIVVVLGSYFIIATLMLSQGITVLIAFVPLFIATIALLVGVLVVGYTIVAVASRLEGRDERDRLIEWRAESNASWILAAGVIAAITTLVFAVEAVWVAHLLLLALLLSEVTKFIFQLVYYRRGMEL